MNSNLSYSDLPPVTVFSLIYNSGKYVIEAIQSVRKNNYPNLQHIIIDDFSTDGVSASLVEDWIKNENYPCTFIKHTKNLGICKTLNEVINLSTGKYLFGVNDDLIDSDRILNHVKLLESADKNVAALWSDVRVIDESNSLVRSSYLENHDYVTQSNELYKKLLTHCFIPMPGATLNIGIIKKEGGFTENIFMEDWDLWLRLSRKYEILFTPEISTSYRIRKGSVTSSPTAQFYLGCFHSVYNNIHDLESFIIAKDKLIYFAEMNYKLKGKETSLPFFRTLKFQFTIKVFTFFLASLIRIPYATIDNLRMLIKSKFKFNA
jgi:GT2 family glycosyltransferase